MSARFWFVVVFCFVVATAFRYHFLCNFYAAFMLQVVFCYFTVSKIIAVFLLKLRLIWGFFKVRFSFYFLSRAPFIFTLCPFCSLSIVDLLYRVPFLLGSCPSFWTFFWSMPLFWVWYMPLFLTVSKIVVFSCYFIFIRWLTILLYISFHLWLYQLF